MFIRIFSIAGVAFAACASVAFAIPGIDETPSPSPPTIAAKSDEPMKAAAGFGMPDGFVVELFAAEPDLANPVAFSIDERGRVFVCETFRQSRGVSDNRSQNAVWVDADRASQSVEDRLQYHLRLLGDKKKDWESADDRVRLLIDADRDGRADTATVFAERFNRVIDGSMAGILARRGDVFVTCIPNLYRLRDVDGDGKADMSPQERTILSTGYGARVAYGGTTSTASRSATTAGCITRSATAATVSSTKAASIPIRAPGRSSAANSTAPASRSSLTASGTRRNSPSTTLAISLRWTTTPMPVIRLGSCM